MSIRELGGKKGRALSGAQSKEMQLKFGKVLLHKILCLQYSE